MVEITHQTRKTRSCMAACLDLRLVALLCICMMVAWRHIDSLQEGFSYDLPSLSLLDLTQLQTGFQSSLPPVSCQQIHDRVRSGHISDPNRGVLYARYTKAEPHFWISVHAEAYDKVRFEILEKGQYYETKLSEAYTEILTAYNNPNSRVIDVGGNIGWFSLLAAASGFDVDVFEPNEFNHIRTCESICLNQWTGCSTTSTAASKGLGNLDVGLHHGNVRVFPYGVLNEEGDFYFHANEMNPGASQLLKYPGNNTEKVRIVTLDSVGKQLGWFDTDIAILKVDVEGFELEVLRGGEELLRSNRVQNLFMEATVGTVAEAERVKPVITLLADAGYKVHKIGGWMGPGDPNVPPMDKNIADSLVKSCKKGKDAIERTQCNLWWKLAKP